MDWQQASDMAVQPSPVLLQAVVKVEQVVARLQELQCTIAGLHLSPHSLKHTRASKANVTPRSASSLSALQRKAFASHHEPQSNGSLNSNRCTPTKKTAVPVERRVSGEQRRRSMRMDKVSPKKQPQQTMQPRGAWKNWSSPANQVHNVVSEILMASQFAKEVATLVADALQEFPVTEKPVKVDQEPVWRVGKEGKKDIAYPNKSQMHKTMTAKATPPDAVHKFKVVFPSEGPAKVGPAANFSRSKEHLSDKGSSSSPYKRRASSSSVSRLSSPKPMASRISRKLVHSPEKERTIYRRVRSPIKDLDNADVKISRHPMGVTEIKGQPKPWKLTPTKGVMFSNPVFMSSPPRSPPIRSSPSKIVPTTGRRKSWLPNHFPKPRSTSREASFKDLSSRRKGSASVNPLSSSFSKVSFKREASIKSDPKASPPNALTKGASDPRKSIKPSRYVEVVPLDGPQDSTMLTVLDILSTRSPPDVPVVTPPVRPARSSRRLMPLDTNVGLVDKPPFTKIKEPVKKVETKALHSHRMSYSSVMNVAADQGKPVDLSRGEGEDSEKENSQVPRCTPAVMFLRSLSNGHSLNRTLSRRNSGMSLMQRAKGWMTSQTVRQESRDNELER